MGQVLLEALSSSSANYKTMSAPTSSIINEFDVIMFDVFRLSLYN
jgi:hypothetical protein